MELPEQELEIPLPGIIESPAAGGGGLDPTPEVESEEEPEAIEPPSLVLENGEFQRRVVVVMNAIHPDNPDAAENNRRLLAEVHTYLSLFDEGIRQSMVDMASMGGPFGMIKKMMQRG